MLEKIVIMRVVIRLKKKCRKIETKRAKVEKSKKKCKKD